MLVLLGWVAGPVHLQAGGQREFPDGWLLNPLDTQYLLTGGPERGYLNRAEGAGARLAIWGAVGQGHLFSMAELPLLWFECGLASVSPSWFPALNVSYERLGGDFLVEENGSVRLGWGSRPRIGIRVRSSSWSLEGEKVAAHLEGDLEGRFHFGLGGLWIGVVGLHLHPFVSESRDRYRGATTIAEFKFLQPGSGASFRVDRKGDGTPLVTFEGMVRLSGRVGMGFRGDPHTGSLGGSLVVLAGGFRLETSHLVHPSLGVTHRFMLGAGDPKGSAR